ncbi:hypothetical protein KOI35_10990 [Actinoplanes bogorensis]|uniref:Secreted protein n=1 Tax=Paractinoplanes bogorensis TaxID=1610840 RepID=A0ABS5YKM1_9ACTN|nr:hypothetical protein [Actinoplanes bogorensis]MBU2664015.1 hypothetical protein [Actinoplanes bogorensis]
MRSLVLRTLGGLVAAGLGLGVAAAPATAAATNEFRLTAGNAVGYGTYQQMMSIPERPVPPISITGTLAARSLWRCAVIQVGRSGPADGLEWQTVGRHCGPGRTSFRAQANYMFRAVNPPVRLCAGWNVNQAERGRRCDLYRPPAN